MGKTNRTSGNPKKEAALDRKAKHNAEVKESKDARAEADEAAKWSVGAKSGKSKKEIAEDKKAAAAAAKADRDAQLAAEEATARASTVSKPAKSSKATPSKKPEPSRGLDLSQLDSPKTSGTATPSLNATGIDNALDALSLTTTEAASDKVDKHPERRFKAAYAAFEARRLKEIEAENPGLRRQQRIEACRKEFEKSPENPFNQVSARYDASKEEVREIKAGERERKEKVLTGA